MKRNENKYEIKDKHSFGEWLKEKRIESDFTQTELSKKLGVTQVTFSTWERSQSLPRINTLKEIVKLFGLPPELQKNKEKEVSSFGVWLRKTRTRKGMTQEELSKKADVTSLAISFIETGHTQSPRAETIESLRKALGEKLNKEVKRDVNEEKEVAAGLGEYYGPFPIKNWKENAKATPCVYVLYDRVRRPVRIGQTKNLSRRLQEYEDNYWWFRIPTTCEFAYVEVSEEKERKQIEKTIIKFLGKHAIFNKQHGI